MKIRIDALGIVAIGLLLFMIIHVLMDRGLFHDSAALEQPQHAQAVMAAALSTGGKQSSTSSVEPASLSPSQAGGGDTIASPYDHFVVTQGPHGADNGQMAVDITAGKGVAIKSAITGTVTALYVDDLGNTTLVIENDHYIVTMLHGIFTVKMGEAVEIGQKVGTESNQGNTIDAAGRSCRGRDCGYHLHINVYDKHLGTNVNPLDLFGQ
jgi:murein DD-endopeptidase MepM/ murein hydrolase activator NlpD